MSLSSRPIGIEPAYGPIVDEGAPVITLGVQKAGAVDAPGQALRIEEHALVADPAIVEVEVVLDIVLPVLSPKIIVRSSGLKAIPLDMMNPVSIFVQFPEAS